MVLAAMLILPLIPAFLLYKFLPSKTNVTGPFKGLNLKLTGAFGGYFLLVIVAVAVFFPLLKNDQMKIIDDQKLMLAEKDKRILELETTAQGKQRWQMIGNVLSSTPKLTKVFFDETGSQFFETGEFSMEFDTELKNGRAALPKAICIFNKDDGYKVLNISREFNSEDIKNYAISFNDSLKQIRIDSVIDIQSIANAKIETETQLLKKLQKNPGLIFNYIPEKNIKILRKDKLRLRTVTTRALPVHPDSAKSDSSRNN